MTAVKVSSADVRSRFGPSSGASRRCFQLAYSWGHMGDSRHLPAFGVSPGTVTSVGNPGAPWNGQLSQLPFYPLCGEVDVLRNDNYILDRASCD